LIVALSCAGPRDHPGLHDQTGAPVSIGSVTRIVSLAPDVTELAFAIGAGSRLVAVPASADYPPQAAQLPRVDPGNLEAIVALRPDLVLATTAGNDFRLVARARALGLSVCCTDVTSFARLAEACRLVAAATGAQPAGTHLAAEIRTRVGALEHVGAALPRRAALYVAWWEPLIVAAPGTFHDDLLRRAGLANLASPSGGRYPRLDPETLLDPRLELVVAPDEPDVRDGLTHVLATSAGARLRAGTLRTIWLPADAANRPGPRLVDALAALVAAREKNP
jgi:ABC-type Fe3+-hydroxamate transport system substrate-binding protein